MTRRTHPRPATDADLEADARRCEEAWAEAVYREQEFRLALRRTFGLPDDAAGTDEF